MFEVYRKTLALLTTKEKRQGMLVLFMVLIMAILETVGVASVLPFLSVLSNPEHISDTPALAWLYAYLNFSNTNDFLIFLGACAFVLVIVSSLFRIATTYVMNRYSQMRRHTVGDRLLETYLRQPYEFFLNRHSGDMAKSILSEVDQLVQNVIRPGLEAVAYSIVGLAIIALLIVIDPWIALGVGSVIGGMYVLIFWAVRGVLGRLGRARAQANRERFTAAGEALGGIKDIKLLGREYAYLSRFRPSSIRYSRYQATNRTLSEAPNFLIEGVGVGGVIILALILLAIRDDLSEVIPLLGLYALAAYKLLPAASKLYTGLAKFRFGASAVNDIYEDLLVRSALAEISKPKPAPMSLQQAVTLKNLTFTYPNATSPALLDINLSIPLGTSVGIVGGTGAGKTTLVDIILGLLTPQSGGLWVDDTQIDSLNVRAWRRSLGYVPQTIFLTDASIAENIALGVAPERIDRTRVTECAQRAQLHEFITGSLTDGYNTTVGERGVRLSGGQRQRIGIARALYQRPTVMVFDEATSALDNLTEKAVIRAVDALSQDNTVIMIAHRLSTVEHCDRIYLIEHGRVAAVGTYKELLADNVRFQAMATTIV